jgi:transcription elongation factor Elf1
MGMDVKIGSGRKVIAIDINEVGSVLDEIKCPECGSTNVNGCHIPFFSFDRESEDSITFYLSDAGIYLHCQECGGEIESQIENNGNLSENKHIKQMALSIVMALHGFLTKVHRGDDGEILTIRLLPEGNTHSGELNNIETVGSC